MEAKIATKSYQSSFSKTVMEMLHWGKYDFEELEFFN